MGNLKGEITVQMWSAFGSDPPGEGRSSKNGLFCTIDAAKTCNGRDGSQVALCVRSLGSD